MIYSLKEQSVLTEGSINLNKAEDRDLRAYRFHLLQGETERHGPRIKVFHKDLHLATYRVDRGDGSITLVGKNHIPQNHQSSMEFIIKELSYASYKLMYKVARDRLESDMNLMQHYTNIIVSSHRTQTHRIAERIRVELNDKIS